LDKENKRLRTKVQNARIITREKMTQADLDRFKEQLEALREQLKELRVYKGSDAIHQGDTWHDNPTLYQAEAQEQALIRQITELEEKIRNAEVVEVPDDMQHVVLGCRVRIRFPDGDEEDYQIMGEASANPSKRIISDKSPLGQALMGKSVGDKVTYQAGNSTHRVKVITIEPA
jgi:transcription elongation factor GreA